MNRSISAVFVLVSILSSISACAPHNNNTSSKSDCDDKRYNIVNLSQSVSRVINNDTLQVVLSIRSKHKDRQVAMNTVSERLNIVMQEIKANPAFEAQLLNRSGREISQHLNNQKDDKDHLIDIPLWEEHSEIVVKSRDFKAINAMLSKVQQVASINEMSFTVSDDKITGLKDELTKEGIGKFNEKANLITQAFGGKRYKIVFVNIGNVDNIRARPMNFMAGVGAPVIVSDSLPGEKTVHLYIDGSIEIVR